ncbi:lytic transglycosylase domain-containing protein [Xenorhabdus eapokensis]|uniref:Type IV secretion system lytic transglycosylase VirB1 n=1 Tax=Xenorhabdus eapokensis TaxID=1873482 RepID=A0A1Q5TKS2_9GAMM|nr:lytic transglycosylase domain-containing protein [Xenorhabdus eapokensis]OKP00833.1 type IV secretion system lytic transglycosylase VirB1 [Xenorhabdus eapokensis]
MIGVDMMMACAPTVAPVTLEKIIQVESKYNPLALHFNAKWMNVPDKAGQMRRQKITFKSPIPIQTVQDAVTVTYMALEAGFSVDMGYMQVNSRNLKVLGYTVEDMFNPCKNLTAGARVLSAFYTDALSRYPNAQTALRAALSAYNTGSFNQGFLNGYLARYGIHDPSTQVNVPALNPYMASTAVYIRPSLLKKENSTMNRKDETQPIVTQRVDPIVSQSSKDAATPGIQVEYTAAEAERNGAFEETAMSEADAWESNSDLTVNDQNATAIVVGGKRVR